MHAARNLGVVRSAMTCEQAFIVGHPFFTLCVHAMAMMTSKPL
jgi:hypothetical protein